MSLYDGITILMLQECPGLGKTQPGVPAVATGHFGMKSLWQPDGVDTVSV